MIKAPTNAKRKWKWTGARITIAGALASARAVTIHADLCVVPHARANARPESAFRKSAPTATTFSADDGLEDDVRQSQDEIRADPVTESDVIAVRHANVRD